MPMSGVKLKGVPGSFVGMRIVHQIGSHEGGGVGNPVVAGVSAPDDDLLLADAPEAGRNIGSRTLPRIASDPGRVCKLVGQVVSSNRQAQASRGLRLWH